MNNNILLTKYDKMGLFYQVVLSPFLFLEFDKFSRVLFRFFWLQVSDTDILLPAGNRKVGKDVPFKS